MNRGLQESELSKPLNLAENSRKTLIELYRVNIDPVGMLELINTGNNLVGLETTSLILPDLQET
ncbi:hypothetical protein [Pectobacterium carotovorum]|uniref:hypothetical protein n=1 Tax=Pectobacterium carotovorum TaxID=554 RepID=UPI0015E0538F|nr:hypothetical protein [Pectobacterium carotovorum]MBA0182013.1 hypothetical protein [Pectobacterium carotovorum]UFT95568.1 hypothetical protein LQF52_05950 [Pectobacterium carotovorum]